MICLIVSFNQILETDSTTWLVTSQEIEFQWNISTKINCTTDIGFSDIPILKIENITIIQFINNLSFYIIIENN